MALLQTSRNHLDSSAGLIDLVDEARDVDVFLARNGVVIDGSPSTNQPADATFKSSCLWKDEGELMIKDGYSQTFLHNLTKKLRSSSVLINAQLAEKNSQLDACRKLETLHTTGQGSGNIQDVQDSSRDITNEISLLYLQFYNCLENLNI
jgi:hypothetical protein